MDTLRPFEVLAFRLIKLMYFYFWPIPFKWSKDFQKFQLSPLGITELPVYISTFLQFLFGLVAAVSICFPTHIQTLSGREVQPVHIAIWVIACVSYWTFSFVFCFLIYHANDIVHTLNQLLRMSASFKSGQSRKFILKWHAIQLIHIRFCFKFQYIAIEIAGKFSMILAVAHYRLAF